MLVTGMGICLLIGSWVDRASKAIALTRGTGVQKKAIAYSIPTIDALTPIERLTVIDPTVQLLLKVRLLMAPQILWPLTYAEQISYAYQILMVIAFGIIKLSITFYYRRIFVIAEGFSFDWITKATITIVVMWTVAFLLRLHLLLWNTFLCQLE